MTATMQISTNAPVKTEDHTTMFTDDSMTDGKGVAADVLSIEYLVTDYNISNFYRLQSDAGIPSSLAYSVLYNQLEV